MNIVFVKTCISPISKFDNQANNERRNVSNCLGAAIIAAVFKPGEHMVINN